MKQVFVNGSVNQIIGTSTRFTVLIGPGDTGSGAGEGEWTSTEARVGVPIPTDGTFNNLAIELDTSPGAGKSWTFTVRKNGADTSLSVTISGTATSGSNTTNSFTVAAGDVISLKAAPTSSPASVRVKFSVEFEPSTAQRFIMCGGHGSGGGLSSTKYSGVYGLYLSAYENYNQTVIPTACTLNAFYVKLQNAPGGSSWRTYTIKKNGTDTSAVVTISGSDDAGNVTGLSISLVAGDVLTLKETTGGSASSSQVGIGLLFTPNTDGESIVAGSSQEAIFNNYYNQLQTGNHSWNANEASAFIPQLGGLTSWTLKNFRVHLSSAPGSGKSMTFKIRKNGANGNSVVTISNTNTQGVDNTNTDTISAGDDLNIVHSSTGSPSSSIKVHWSAVQYIVSSSDLSINVSDNITVAESVNTAQESRVNVFDNSTVSEFLKLTLIHNISVNDPTSLTENINALSVNNISIFDNSTLTENIQTGQNNFINVFDNSTLTENIQTGQNNFINVFDQTVTTESLSLILEQIIIVNVFDNSTLTENIQTRQDNFINVFDNSALTENIQTGQNNFINVFDQTVTTESLNLILEQIITVSVFDNSTLTENIQTRQDNFINVFDNSALTENIQTGQNNFINVFDNSAVTEFLQLTLIHNISVNDLISPTENINALSINNISIFDNSTLTENIQTRQDNFINVFDQTVTTESLSLILEQIIAVSVFNNIYASEVITTIRSDKKEGVVFMKSKQYPVGLDATPKLLLKSKQQSYPISLDANPKLLLKSKQQSYPVPLDDSRIL